MLLEIHFQNHLHFSSKNTTTAAITTWLLLLHVTAAEMAVADFGTLFVLPLEYFYCIIRKRKRKVFDFL